MALKNLAAWSGNRAVTACGAACGASDKPAEEPKPAACGASDKPAEEPKPVACGAACGAGDK